MNTRFSHIILSALFLYLSLLLLSSCSQQQDYSRISSIEQAKTQDKDDTKQAAQESEYTHADYYEVNKIQRKGNVKKPKNVIIMIGDGMGPAQVAAGMIANKGQMYMQQAEYSGLSITQNAYGEITDSAAGATAMATGTKTYNKAIAVDTSGAPLSTIMAEAHQKGLSTGLVVGCEIIDATPASFAVHHPDRNEREAIASKFIEAPVDFLYGGGRKYFDQRSDNQNLLNSWKEKGYQIVDNAEQLQAVNTGKVVALFDANGPARVSERKADYIQNGVHKALALLSQNEQGFMMMIEGSQIDDAGHFNELDYNVQEVLDFDKVIGEVFKFAAQDGETLVVITADHETGGLTITDEDTKTGSVTAEFSSTDHTAVMVPVFAFGPGSELFSGFYQNTEIYHRAKKALEW